MNLNPFDLAGPEFLFFYVVAAAAVILYFRYRISALESGGDAPALPLTDPFEIAQLRGGDNEAMRVAAVSLVDRGLLIAVDDTLKAKSGASKDLARRPLEKAILAKFASKGDAKTMFGEILIGQHCAAYRESLERKRLLAGDEIMEGRKGPFLAALGVLLGLAGIKIWVAINRGHANVGFLILLSIAAVVILVKLSGRKRTGMGDRVLEDLRTLFAGLKQRAHLLEAGGRTNEAVMLAAVFGIQSLDQPGFAFAKKLFPKASKQDGSSCGSGCGSSGGSSCGSGCGGGGGCGGCGGGD